jgi:anti-anti-sigma factor
MTDELTANYGGTEAFPGGGGQLRGPKRPPSGGPHATLPTAVGPETPMTSVGTISRRTGSRPEAGPPAARILIRLRGALDVAAAPALRERLIGLLHPGMKLLVLDLSRVPSCDPAGLAVLIGTQRRARPLGIVVLLAAPTLPVARLLRLTGLDRSFTICPDLRGALAVERHEPAEEPASPQVLAG